jgi:hypothetical protein
MPAADRTGEKGAKKHWSDVEVLGALAVLVARLAQQSEKIMAERPPGDGMIAS